MRANLCAPCKPFAYNRDLPEHVELFYLALREVLGRTIRIAGDAAENVELEITDAA